MGVSPTLNWKMVLVVFLEIFPLLMYFRYFCEWGVSRSLNHSREYLGDFAQDAVHLSLIFSFLA